MRFCHRCISLDKAVSGWLMMRLHCARLSVGSRQRHRPRSYSRRQTAARWQCCATATARHHVQYQRRRVSRCWKHQIWTADIAVSFYTSRVVHQQQRSSVFRVSLTAVVLPKRYLPVHCTCIVLYKLSSKLFVILINNNTKLIRPNVCQRHLARDNFTACPQVSHLQYQ